MAPPKGHKQWGHIKKGQKTAKILAREELRKIFEEETSAVWRELVKAQLKDATKNYKARQYSIDQAIGTAPKTIEIEGEVKLKLDV